MDINSDKQLFHKCFSKQVQNQLGELFEYDKKNNELLLNKILQFENENKDLKEKNKNIQFDVEDLKKLMKNAQKDSEKLRKNYKMLQEEEDDLLVKLQNTKKLIQQNEAELSERPRRKRRKTTEGSIDNRNGTNKSHLVNEGLLVIRYLYL